MLVTRAAFAIVAGAALGVLALSGGACQAEAESDTPSDGDAEGGAESSIPDAPAERVAKGERCTSDVDCIAPNGCYTPHCDVVLGACTYALCEPTGRTCAAGICTRASSTCSDSRDYGLRTTRYPIDGAVLGCPSDATGCFAAIYPFAFVGTKDDVVVVRVDDLLATSSTKVMRTGPTVRPAHLVASARRLWIVGEVQGTAPPYQLPVSWIDVPSDPTVASVVAQGTTLSWPFPDSVAFPAPESALFLASGDAAQGFPTALLKPPFPAAPTAAVANPPDAGPPSPLPTHPMYRVGAPGGSTLVASSGSRLVVDRGSVVNLVTAAGTPSAAVQGDLNLQPPFAPFSQPRFAQGPDGVVLLAAPILADGPPPDCDCTSHERAAWVLPNAIANDVDVNQAIDFEGYKSNQKLGGLCHQCMPTYVTLPSIATWIDGATALVVAAASGGPAQQAAPAIRVVTRDPPRVVAKRRFVPAPTETPLGTFGVDRISLTSSNGFGYLLVSDALNSNVTLSIFDPRCDAK